MIGKDLYFICTVFSSIQVMKINRYDLAQFYKESQCIYCKWQSVLHYTLSLQIYRYTHHTAILPDFNFSQHLS